MHRVRVNLWIMAAISSLGMLLGPAGAWAQASDPDLNNDGVVNILDVSIVGSCFGQNPTVNLPCQVADTNGDGNVDFSDLNFVTASFGQTGFPTEVEDTIPPEVTITSPPALSFFNNSPVTVSGEASQDTTELTVNGVSATFGSQTWTATVPLEEGNNTLTAVGTDAAGNVGTASIQVTLDTTSPRVTIDSPPDGFVTTSSSVTVTGMINDIVVGTVNGDQAQVTVNGAPAQVANRSFLVADVPLSPGLNALTAIGTDRAGNTATTSITVTFEAILAEPQVQLFSGNNQTSPIGSQLPDPLVVALVDGNGNPVPGETVIFKVTENNGTLSGSPEEVRSLAVTTDAQGRAQARWTLGTRAGAGNNRVEATAVGFAGNAIFTATALPAAPDKINVDAGNNQVGVGGQPLPNPFVAVVTDAGHNRLANVPVTFTILQGGGNFNGQPTLTLNTDSDGRALAILTLGLQEGIDNNIVGANFLGNPGLSASFVASGRVAGNPADTKISGVVLDNTDQPIPGVTLRIEGTELSTQSDEQGQFVIQPAPVGHVLLVADGSTAQRPGTWPVLKYDLVTIAGQDNTIGMPIYLLPLNLPNGLSVDETTGGILTLLEMPGFSLTVEPGSATFPDGLRSGLVSVTVVHADKVPMVPNFGGQPRFIVSIQPAGLRFDPPAPITLPNTDGLTPGEMTELFSFDHDLGQFVAIGTGSVSEDGTVIQSDPGVGIIKGGWHAPLPPAPTGCLLGCGPCEELKTDQGTCTCEPLPDETICDDGNECTFGETCFAGECGDGDPVMNVTSGFPSERAAWLNFLDKCKDSEQLQEICRPENDPEKIEIKLGRSIGIGISGSCSENSGPSNVFVDAFCSNHVDLNDLEAIDKLRCSDWAADSCQRIVHFLAERFSGALGNNFDTAHSFGHTVEEAYREEKGREGTVLGCSGFGVPNTTFCSYDLDGDKIPDLVEQYDQDAVNGDIKNIICFPPSEELSSSLPPE